MTNCCRPKALWPAPHPWCGRPVALLNKVMVALEHGRRFTGNHCLAEAEADVLYPLQRTEVLDMSAGLQRAMDNLLGT